MKEFNYKINKVSDDDFDNIVSDVKDLPIYNYHNYFQNYNKTIIEPIDPEIGENQPYWGWISIWKEIDNNYHVVFFLSYYLGRDFFTDEVTVSIENDIKLESTIKEMISKYSDKTMIDKLICDQIEKEKSM